jgi:hypothetical protein
MLAGGPLAMRFAAGPSVGGRGLWFPARQRQDVGAVGSVGSRLGILGAQLAPNARKCLSDIRFDARRVSKRGIEDRFHMRCLGIGTRGR